jgi:hypothetical protein
MADLRADLFDKVNECHNRYFDKVEAGENLLVNIGMAYVDFAIEEPNLFRMLFMSHGFSGKKLTDFFSFCDDSPNKCNTNLENILSKSYDITLQETKRISIDIWLYAHGIASMLATNQLSTPRSEIKSMLKNMYAILTSGLLEKK